MGDKKEKQQRDPVSEIETLETEETILEQEDGGTPDPTAQLQQQLGEAKDQLLRTLAEYDNYRKRSIKEKESIYPDATAAAVKEFLPIMDNFKRALDCQTGDQEFRKGIEMIFSSLKAVFDKFGVEEFGKSGEQFCPEHHNAVMHIDDDQYAENAIVEVLQTGYRIGERVLRYAMVKVAN